MARNGESALSRYGKESKMSEFWNSPMGRLTRILGGIVLAAGSVGLIAEGLFRRGLGVGGRATRIILGAAGLWFVSKEGKRKD